MIESLHISLGDAVRSFAPFSKIFLAHLEHEEPERPEYKPKQEPSD
jgi:hypothetical protein